MSSELWRLKVQNQGVGWWVSSEASLLRLEMAVFSLSLLCLSSTYVCVLISFYKETGQGRLGSTLRSLFYLRYLFKDLKSKYILRYQGLGFQHMNFARTRLAHNSPPTADGWHCDHTLLHR